MRKLNSLMLALVLLAHAFPAVAATPSEFYINLLRRGVADVEAGEFARATDPLRLAAFGLVDSIEHYQTAQVCLAVAWQKQAKTEAARDAARRVVSAQRIERRYIALSISPSIRSQFESIAPQLLTSEEFALLHSRLMASSQPAAAVPPASQQAARPAPTPQQTVAATEPKPRATAPVAAAQQQAPPAAVPQAVQSAPQSAAAEPDERPAVRQAEPVPATTQSESLKPAPATASTATTSEPAPKSAAPTAAPAAAPAQQNPPVAQTPAPAPPKSQPQAGSATQNASRPAPQPVPAKTADAAPARPGTRTVARRDVPSQLAAASAAVDGAQLAQAKQIYHELLGAPELDRSSLVKVAEGLYRVRDFAGSLEAFTRLGALRKGEEPYRYYVAVVLYETGQYAKAKAELAAALPFIEVTDDVARYRAKIEGAAR